MTTRERGRVFGEVAESYHRVRPGYPAALASDLLELAGPGPVLEIGAGTGKATAAFAAHTNDLTCLEPDPRMAAVLRRDIPGVPVVESTFENWAPDRAYRLLVVGQAWHWVDPVRRGALAAAALASGGLLAPFWNVHLIADPDLYTALRAVDERHALIGEHTPHSLPAAGRSAEPGPFDEEWPDFGLPADSFTELRTLRYVSARSYSANLYREHLMSLSLYRTLPPGQASAAVDDTIAVVEKHSGSINFVIHTDVAVARRR